VPDSLLGSAKDTPPPPTSCHVSEDSGTQKSLVLISPVVTVVSSLSNSLPARRTACSGPLARVRTTSTFAESCTPMRPPPSAPGTGVTGTSNTRPSRWTDITSVFPAFALQQPQPQVRPARISSGSRLATAPTTASSDRQNDRCL
jgi:hypothetical protein